jgi:hypothetical protein
LTASEAQPVAAKKTRKTASRETGEVGGQMRINLLWPVLVLLACGPLAWAQVTIVPGGKPEGKWDTTSIWIILLALSPVMLFLSIRLLKGLSDWRAKKRSP